MLPPSKIINRNPEFENQDFFDRVYFVVRKIPRGRVTSYGAIANYLGCGLSARTVGWALNSCHKIKPPVPAHRVVNRNGMLTGKIHFPSPVLMEELLTFEGIKISDDRVVDFEKHFWNPNSEL